MKSYYLLFFITLWGGWSLQAQEQHKAATQKWSFGTQLGLAYGSPIGPSDKGSLITIGTAPNDVNIQLNDPKGTPQAGLLLGLFSRYRINEKIQYQVGLAFNIKKARYEAPAYDQDYVLKGFTQPDGTYLAFPEPDTIIFNGNVRGNFNNSYLSLPISLRYQMNPKWNINMGFYTAKLLTASHQVWATGIVGDNFLSIEEEYSDESAAINQWDYGMQLGVAYKIYHRLETSLHVSSGLHSIFSDDYLGTDDTVRNIYLKLAANYIFDF